MTLNKKSPARRQRRGSAWYWQATDAWYYTSPETKRRVPLRDKRGRIIRGKDQKQAARSALARERVGRSRTSSVRETSQNNASLCIAQICAEYIARCERAEAAGRLHPEQTRHVKRTLNVFCRFCGALPVGELKRVQVSEWVESVAKWRSPATRRNVLTAVISALRHAEAEHGVRNPLRGLKKPPHRPRLHSISPADERMLFAAAPPAFRDFLFAALHSGLRPFCELVRLRAEDVEETPHGMLWRVRSSKTKKVRKIPVRPEVAKLTRRLLKTAPVAGGLPIFRNPEGNPWKKVTGVRYFLRLKLKLGWTGDDVRAAYSTYSCRHTFAHRMLSGYWNGGVGCSIEVLAELMGDTPKTAFDHYGKEWGRHYQEPLWAALGL